VCMSLFVGFDVCVCVCVCVEGCVCVYTCRFMDSTTGLHTNVVDSVGIVDSYTRVLYVYAGNVLKRMQKNYELVLKQRP
jgi:hypothetical protein